MKRDTFLFYRSFYDAIECLPKKDRLAAFEAVCRYALDGDEPALPSSAVSAFVIVKSSAASERLTSEPMPGT